MSDTATKWDAQLRKGSLELVVLAALAPGPRYGLALLNHLHQFDTMQITEGTLYPLLDRLKRDGVISANWQQQGDERPRKYYALTTEGQQRLTDLGARWRQSVADIEALLQQAA
ncbi:PadR family transcriptional regulator [Aestuariibacter halophilus]|uniref:PadR family transcriptional regulator n=1 Tax=Fluctibacter halophilus TaxID=226011 RepID=A0ABS8G8E0_9ALTE|nr:PadR family transcriptional regulator [Aestuariibacter halophilus]MCC2616842.1 PadR family transcriptional regulator [Aestuariibacter halophilus]